MRSQSDLRRAIERCIEREYNVLRDEVLKDRTEELEARIHRLAVFGNLRKQLSSSFFRHELPAIVVALGCVLLAGWLWRTPSSPTRVLLSVEANGVQIEPTSAVLATPRMQNELSGAQLSAAGIDEVRVSPGIDWLPDVPLQTVNLCEGQFLLDRIKLEPLGSPQAGRIMEVQMPAAYMPRIFVTRMFLRTDIRLWGNVRIRPGPCVAREQRRTTVPQALAETAVISGRGNAVPSELSLTFNGDAALTFRDFDVQALSFVTETAEHPNRKPMFVSTIRKASINLPDTGASYAFGKGVFLSLPEFSGRVRELRIGEHVKVEAEGTAAHVVAGPKGFEQDITPSMLEYFAYNRQITLIWSALAFIWGLAWSTRRLFAR